MSCDPHPPIGDAPVSTTKKKDRTHWLYIAVHHRRRSRHRRRVWCPPSSPSSSEAARHRLRQPDQDDDRAGHLLHDRAGHRIGPQGLPGRQGRRHRPGLLPDHVDARPRRSAWWSATSSTRARVCTSPPRSPRRRPTPVTAEKLTHRGVPAAHHPDHPVLRADHRGRAADAVGGTAGRLRPAGDGQERRADPEGCRSPAEAGVPDPGHDHVAGPARRLRRDRRRRRRDRRRRPEEPRRC